MSEVKDITSANVYRICRICLLEQTNMMSMYDTIATEMRLESDVYSFIDLMCKVTNLQANEHEDAPTLLCQTCILLLESAYRFKLHYEKSCRAIEQYILNKQQELKVEDADSCYSDNVQHFDNEDVEVAPETVTRRQPIKKQNTKRTITRRRKGRSSRRKSNFDNNEDDDVESAETGSLSDKVKQHPCPVCTKEFPALELREHAHTHKALKKYLSIPAKHKVSSTARFYYKRDPDKVKITLHNMPVKLHQCVLCELKLTADEMKIHLESHRNQKEYKCDQCERVFKKLNHLNTHKVKHLKEFPYKCEHCGKGFVIKTNYDCHILTHNTNQELPHECTHCLRRFSNPEHLNRHVIIHTENVSYSVKYRVCKCHHCLKTFKDRTELKAHECVPVEHAVNTRFPCKVCNKVFKNSNGLYNHNRNIHKLKGAKVLCSVCGNYVSNIYNHMMRHNGEKPYQCNQCGKRFVGKPQLRQHLLVHSGLKPFVCSVCAKAFNNLYNLQVHERIHKGDRCHICPLCNKGFLEKSYLKKHMNIHTRL